MSIVNHQIVGFSKKQRSVVNSSLLWQEREWQLVKVYWKKEMVERAIIRIIHNKIIEFTSRRMYIQAKGKYHHFHAPQYRNCLRRGPNTAWFMGEKYGNGKKYRFLSPINFFTSFSVTSRRKTGPGGKILYCFSSSSYPRSCLGRKVK